MLERLIPVLELTAFIAKPKHAVPQDTVITLQNTRIGPIFPE